MTRVIALFVLLGLATPADGQITMGAVTLSLGSSRDETLTRLRQHYRVDSLRALDQWMIFERTTDGVDPLGSIIFQRGRLIRVTRSWNPRGAPGDAIEAVRAVMGALAQLESNAPVRCTVAEGTTRNPGGRVDEVTLRCGDRQIAIAIVRVDGRDHISISEVLGPDTVTPGADDAHVSAAPA